MSDKVTDTLIIGGGLAGLHSAYQLSKAGKNAVLLEANARLGGRILSEAGGQRAVGYDLGPTWFWPHQHQLLALLNELAVPFYEQFATGDVLYQLHPDQAPTKVGGSNDMLSYRVEGGMQRLIEALTAKLLPSQCALLNDVTHVEKDGEGWSVKATTPNGVDTWRADHLVLAMPPRIIAHYGNTAQWASPALQQELASQQTWMAGQAKFAATYARPFWREQGYSGGAFSRIGPMVQISDASAAENDHYALFGFIGMPAQMRQQVGPETLKQACVTQLAKLFGEDARAHTALYLKDWAQDKRVATSADIREPSRHAHFPMQHFEAELQSLNLSLAGSEFAAHEAGYLEGALLASQAAVDQVLAKHPAHQRCALK